eukprot:6189034-Pleurochrysis_carterae.AAC.1
MHTTHATLCGGAKAPDGSWVSRRSAAYPPDLKLVIAAPRHRSTAPSRFRYVTSRSHGAARGRIANCDSRRTDARDSAPSADRPQSQRPRASGNCTR